MELLLDIQRQSVSLKVLARGDDEVDDFEEISNLLLSLARKETKKSFTIDISHLESITYKSIDLLLKMSLQMISVGKESHLIIIVNADVAKRLREEGFDKIDAVTLKILNG